MGRWAEKSYSGANPEPPNEKYGVGTLQPPRGDAGTTDCKVIKKLEGIMEEIGRTADGAVVVNRSNSHLHDDVKPIIADALSRVHTCGRPFIEGEVDFGAVIGTSCCVSTGPKDCIVFAQRPHRKGLTRFVLDRDKEPTTKVMVVLKQTVNLSEYVLITAFIGGKAELEPWDTRATPASLKFWQSKALVWGEPIVKGTATIKYPW